jgi:hypothetical protein
MFTDDNLKRLKKYIDGEIDIEIGPAHLAPLLARLEAAEKVIEWVDENVPGEWDGVKPFQAWRKAAGK